MLLLASDDNAEPPVAMVFTHRVAKDKVEDYLEWRRKAIAAQAHYPGYLATEFFRPHGTFQNEWVDIVRYRSVDDLNRWMESEERQALLKELEPIVESMHAHPMTGLEGWFALNREPGATVSGPPPMEAGAGGIVRALSDGDGSDVSLNPLWHNLSLAESMLIGNFLSVEPAYVSGHATGEPISEFLARGSDARLEEGGARLVHGRDRAGPLRSHLPGAVNDFEICHRRNIYYGVRF